MRVQEGPAAPDPDQAADLAEFISLLGALRVWAGQPALRLLAKRVGPLMRPAQDVPPSTVSDAFNPRRRRLDIDLVTAIVRALGLDEAAVARWRAACVRVHAAAKIGGPVGVFRQLPPDLSTFTGRKDELARLTDLAGAPGAAAPTVVVSAIEGMAGVGKTRLAVRAAHELVAQGRYSDVQLYVNLRGFDPEQAPADPAAVLDSFLRQLEVPAQQIPDGLDARAAMFRDRMQGRSALVLLDNAADEEQVRDLIPAGPDCLVLVTSRRSLGGLDGADLLMLDVFTPDEAIGLLERIIGPERVRAEQEPAARLVEACGFLPLALSLAAARLRSRPAWRIADLVGRISSDSLDAIQAGGRALRPVLDLSFQELPGRERRFLCLLGLIPGADFSVRAAAALADVGIAEAGAMLEFLLDEHLLQCAEPGRYNFHDLVRAYASEKAGAELTPGEAEAALERLVTWLLATTAAVAERMQKKVVFAPPATATPATAVDLVEDFADHVGALEWCEAERHNLVVAVRVAMARGHADLAWRFPVNLFDFYHARHYTDDWMAILEEVDPGLDRATEPRARALVANHFACVHLAKRDLDKAAAWAERAAERYSEIGDKRGQAAVLNNQAMIVEEGGDPDRAVAVCRKALAVFTEIGAEDGQAITMNNIASIEVDRDDPRAALALLLPAAELIRDLDFSFTYGKILTNLTVAYQQLGLASEAHSHAATALDVLRETGNEHDEGLVLESLGVLLEQDGDAAGAREHWNRAHAILVEQDSPYVARVEKRLAGLQAAGQQPAGQEH